MSVELRGEFPEKTEGSSGIVGRNQVFMEFDTEEEGIAFREWWQDFGSRNFAAAFDARQRSSWRLAAGPPKANRFKVGDRCLHNFDAGSDFHGDVLVVLELVPVPEGEKSQCPMAYLLDNPAWFRAYREKKTHLLRDEDLAEIPLAAPSTR